MTLTDDQVQKLHDLVHVICEDQTAADEATAAANAADTAFQQATMDVAQANADAAAASEKMTADLQALQDYLTSILPLPAPPPAPPQAKKP